MSARVTLAVAVASVALCARALADEPKKVEKTAKLEGDSAALGLKPEGFDCSFDRVQVKHQPDAKDLAKLDKEPKAQWRPRISVDYANPGNVRLDLSMAVTLQDESGKDLLTCEDKATVAPKAKSDYKVLCLAKAMALADWPKVAKVRFTGSAAPSEPTLDKSFPLSKTVAEIKEKVGPIIVERVVITAAPTDAQIKEAQESKPTANCHPRVMLLLSNPTDDKVKVELKVTVEDKSGTAYLSCERADKLSPHKMSDDLTVCMGQPMKVADWPGLTQVHVVVAVK